MWKEKLPRPLACRCSADEIARINEIAATSGATRHRILCESVTAGLPIVAKRRGLTLPAPAGQQSEINPTL